MHWDCRHSHRRSNVIMSAMAKGEGGGSGAKQLATEKERGKWRDKQEAGPGAGGWVMGVVDIATLVFL